MSTRRMARIFSGLVAAASTTLLAAPSAVAAGDGGLPGMCSSGQPAPLTTLNAHANGTPKYLLNLETDAAGDPTGVLVVGRGADRLYVDDLCGFWQHQPGQVPGHDGEEVPEGATIVHAVGIGTLRDGTRVLARTDVRETDEGTSFRVRYRPMGQHGEGEDEGEESWTRVPVEGWAPLDLLNLR